MSPHLGARIGAQLLHHGVAQLGGPTSRDPLELAGGCRAGGVGTRGPSATHHQPQACGISGHGTGVAGTEGVPRVSLGVGRAVGGTQWGRGALTRVAGRDSAQEGKSEQQAGPHGSGTHRDTGDTTTTLWRCHSPVTLGHPPPWSRAPLPPFVTICSLCGPSAIPHVPTVLLPPPVPPCVPHPILPLCAPYPHHPSTIPCATPMYSCHPRDPPCPTDTLTPASGMPTLGPHPSNQRLCPL